MGILRHDLPYTDPTAGPDAALPPLQKPRHLTVVPLIPDRATSPPAGDWAAAMQRVAQAQDREAFAGLFGHFAPRVKSYLMRTGSNDEMAEELAQEAMVAVWRKAALFNPAQAAVSTWIFTIARNLRIDAARRRPLDASHDGGIEPDELDDGQDGVDERVDAQRLASRVREALHRLPSEQAQVLRLSFYDDEPHSRIATELGIPLGTVKSRVRLAVAHLRRLLET